jgi:deazaflavin-dependent oxidoreductase (nitroreductase family)
MRDVSILFLNKIANPFVRLILRSPLHPLLSSSIILVTYRGRKTGRRYTLPVQYAREDDAIYVVPGNPDKKSWWRNLRGGASVDITLRGELIQANGAVLEPDVDRESIIKGLAAYLQRFPSLSDRYKVHVESDGRLSTEDIQTASRSVKVVRIGLKAPYSRVRG